MTYLDISQGTRASWTALTNASTSWRVELGMANGVAVINTALIAIADSTGTNDKVQFKWLGSPTRDQLVLTLDGTAYTINGSSTGSIMEDNAVHDHIFDCDGATLTWKIDGTIIGSVACTSAFDDFSRVIGNHKFSYLRHYDTSSGDVLTFNLDAASSDTGNTGTQPVIEELVSNNDAIGVGFPADGSAWFVDGPSVTQTDTTPEDSVQQTLTTSGLTGTPTGTLAGKALTLSGTLPNLTYTLDVSAVGASEGMPRIGETSTVAITGNEGTATTDVVIQPKTGWTRTVLAGTLDKSANGFLATLDADLGITSAVGDIIYFDASSAAAITATGVYSSDLTSAGQKTDFVIQQGGSATTVATSQGGSFYPYGASLSKGLGRLSMSIKIGL